jgi:hypothetical protein
VQASSNALDIASIAAGPRAVLSVNLLDGPSPRAGWPAAPGVCETYDDALRVSLGCLVMPMRALISILPACSLALGLGSVTHAFGEGWCSIIEVPMNQQAVPGDPKASVGSVHSKVKGQRGTLQLDDTKLKALILEHSAQAYCDGARIVEGDESGQRIR